MKPACSPFGSYKMFLKTQHTEKSINSEYGKMELKGSVHEFESDD